MTVGDSVYLPVEWMAKISQLAQMRLNQTPPREEKKLCLAIRDYMADRKALAEQRESKR